MNTLGVVLSACCLLVSLAELYLRSDQAGRRMAAMMAAAAWVTMGFVALDQHRQCQAIEQRQGAITVPARQIVAEALKDQWKHEAQQATHLAQGKTE